MFNRWLRKATPGDLHGAKVLLLTWDMTSPNVFFEILSQNVVIPQRVNRNSRFHKLKVDAMAVQSLLK
jgi:hypothetical protein